MYKKFELDNKMKVILAESHKSPVVSVQLWVKTGSADEVKGEEGLSHFIEHLVFKGTRKYKVGEIANLIEGSGGELNAYTSFDQTVYYVTISKNYLDMAFDAISEMVGHPLFDKDEIDNEREVVIEEIKQGEDSPDRQSSRLLFSSMYKTHPYGRPVIGYERIIKKVKKEKILNYYHKRYVPQNMTLVVSGDFEKKEINEKVKKYFGDFQKRPLEKRKRPKIEKQLKPMIKIKKGEFQKNQFYISWPIPKASHKDLPALEVLALILGQGGSSRLVQELRVKKHIVNSIGTSLYTPLDKGFLTIAFTLNLDHLKVALEEIFKKLIQLKSEFVSEEELLKAKINIDSENYYGAETVGGIARRVGSYEHTFNDYSYFKVFEKMIHEVTKEDIIRVYKKYFKPEHINFVGHISNKEKECLSIIKKEIKAYEKRFNEKNKRLSQSLNQSQKNKNSKSRKKTSSKISSFKANSKLNAFKKIELKNNITLLVRQNFETPLISLKVASLGGVRSEVKPGLTQLFSMLWGQQTKKLNESALSNYIDSMASSLGAFGGRNTIGLSMVTLKSFEAPMRDLFLDIFKHPQFDEKSLEREKQIIKEHLKRRTDSPGQIAVLQFMSEMFKGHPYSIDMMGTEESLNSINLDDLYELHKKTIYKGNITFSLSGSVDINEWAQYLEKNLSDLPNSGLDPHKQFPFRFDKEKTIFKKSDKKQTHILLGYPGLTFKDENRYTLSVIQAILSGQGGRLFIELRDKASLAYSVSPYRMEGIDAGHFSTYIACSPEKSKTAIKMLKEELSKLTQNYVSEEELIRAKRYLIGKHDIDLQKNSSISSSLLFDEIYGVPYDETYRFSEKISAVTKEQVTSLASKIFTKPHLISVVGAENPFL